MTTTDWIALAIVSVTALNGLRLGLVAGALSLGGLLLGGYLGARIGSQVLSNGDGRYTPLVTLAGAVAGAVIVQSIAMIAGSAVRNALFVARPLRLLDTIGGVLLGAATGLALVWVLGAVALHLPGQTDLRRDVQASEILRRLNSEFPPQRLMDALGGVDPFGSIRGPGAEVAPPDPGLLDDPGVQAARHAVVRVTGTACGLGIEGSGWIVRPGTVVTNAHVVAGVDDARVDRADDNFHDARVISFDVHDDVAILRVPGLDGRPLALAEPLNGRAVAILGYPENGPFAATPARLGRTTRVLTEDAYGRRPVARTVTTLRGRVVHGNSGGPAVDSQGHVRATIFASRIGSADGFGIPASEVREALEGAKDEVSTGDCVR